MNNMSKTYKSQSKQKRVRLNPIKKWSVNEEKALLEFLLNSKIEKPTAQTYYRRFCDEYNFNIGWKTVRTKVKNMRNSYYRTKAWENGDAVAFLNKEEIKNGVLRKCSNYHELETIFGNRDIKFSSEEKFLVSENNNFMNSVTIGSDENSLQRTDDDVLPTVSKIFEPEIMEIKPDLVDIKSLQLDQALSIKCQELDVRESELRLKDKLRVMKIILKENRLELKEKQLISKEKIKMYEIDSQEKIKIMELEMKERLAMEELKLKYK